MSLPLDRSLVSVSMPSVRRLMLRLPIVGFSLGADKRSMSSSSRPIRFYWCGAILQVADRPILPFEQFGLGGGESVRGYRQDALLSDSGLFASAEARFPIARFAKDSLLQVAPFVDVGTVWNNSPAQVAPQTLLSTGLGLRYQFSDRLTAKVEWGIPLISLPGVKRTWQENGIYFSFIYNPF